MKNFMRIDIQDDLIAGRNPRTFDAKVRKVAQEFAELGLGFDYAEKTIRSFATSLRKPVPLFSLGRFRIFRLGRRCYRIILPDLFLLNFSLFGSNFDLETLDTGVEFGSNIHTLSGGMLRLTRESVENFGFVAALYQELEEGI